MSDSSSLGERMKSYELVGRSSLVKKVPVIARLDGKAFHTFTRDRNYIEQFVYIDSGVSS